MKVRKTAVAANAKRLANRLVRPVAVLLTSSAKTPRKANSQVSIIRTQILNDKIASHPKSEILRLFWAASDYIDLANQTKTKHRPQKAAF